MRKMRDAQIPTVQRGKKHKFLSFCCFLCCYLI